MTLNNFLKTKEGLQMLTSINNCKNITDALLYVINVVFCEYYNHNYDLHLAVDNEVSFLLYTNDVDYHTFSVYEEAVVLRENITPSNLGVTLPRF